MARGRWKRGDFTGGAATWAQNYAAAGPNLTKGIAAPRRDPTAAAVAAQPALLAGFNAAVTSGQWAAALQKAGLAGWQSGMSTYAKQGMQMGASKGQPRVLAFQQSFGPAMMQQVANLPARGPAGTNQARSATINEWSHSNRGKYRHAWRGGT